VRRLAAIARLSNVEVGVLSDDDGLQRRGEQQVSETNIRVLVVEDNFYTRYGTVAFLGASPGIEVAGMAADGATALALFDRLQPDVVLVDLRLPVLDGVELTRRLCQRDPCARVLVLTSYRSDEDIFGALKAGARGYLTKDSSGEELVAAIVALHAGERFFPPAISERIAHGPVGQLLTRRERQVLERVADGASNQEVAEHLGICERTVEVYVSSILNKLGARSRTEAVSMALHHGLLTIAGI
jgi:DNA-binding NarL/FixJ family response regulator